MRGIRVRICAALVLLLCAGLGASQILRQRIQRRLEEKQQQQEELAASAKVNPRGAASCGDPAGLNLGFRILRFSSGLRAGVWYPTRGAETRYEYAMPFATALALDAPPADCSRYPLVVFSHGYGGCGTQSLFFTEALARAGYIVVAPDHKDALCQVDEKRSGLNFQRAEEPFRRPQKWSDATYRDRGDDIRLVIDEMLRDPVFGARIDRSRIGGAGHSLGGYTIMALVGGWSSWKDNRIKAALLLSPYIEPFLQRGTIPSVHVPIMYQGGTRDFGITPPVKKKGGAYDVTNPPKFFEELPEAGHFMWSNRACQSFGSVPACVEESATARMINEYGIAFFDRYLNGKNEPVLDQAGTGLAEYRHAAR